MQQKLKNCYEELYQNIMILRRSYQEIGDTAIVVKEIFAGTIKFYTALFLLVIDARYGHASLSNLVDLIIKSDIVLPGEGMELLETILPHELFLQIQEILIPLSKLSFTESTLHQYNLIALLNMDPWVAGIATFYAKDKDEFTHVLGEYAVRPRDEQFYSRLNTIGLLRETDFFKNIPANYLVAITEYVHEEIAYEGDAIVKEGDPGDSLYIISSGEVSILKSDKEIAKLGAGECIGEMAILDRLPRSATAIAKTEVHLLRIDADDFSDLILNFPEIAQNLLIILARRLRNMLASKA